MKISDIHRIGAMNPYKQAGGAKAQSGLNRSLRKDEVQISPEAMELLENKVTNKTERIAELKQSVATGTYHVEANKIAEKLLPFIK
ncbi:flagellar biosynthesis anti-sigma factor FlgM [Paenibacillus sp. N1-5-1-14]|uniref:flagellar biosynthesis anti-sigma factor FlgM n=1 Tax=Paenibacillus radicibacter TaxID=2972488 RepID=UPI0021594BE7|nr:flagellar biosynthesis anti-sigma factor FlgM [Paenibacillus radicibacter]MCR8645045.1 flagellar biosynthesis anti-sigma factor FlgM [Paenibacillus radicibacter]